MKLLIVILAFTAVNAVSDDTRVCCTAAGATTCTPNIPAGLCRDAGGSYEDTDLEGTCCCFAGGVGDGNRCLPNTPKAVCFGESVQGTCQAEESERCCCRPAGEVNDLDCVPRIPVPLCDKTPGAECVVAPTVAPVCFCTIGEQPARELPEDVCTKFGGQCSTAPPGPTTCCCIWEGQTDALGNPLNPDPTDPGVKARGECLDNTLISTCHEKRKRSGVCWTGPLGPSGAPADPRCRCVDPDFLPAEVPIKNEDGTDAMLLVHVCEEKRGSTCIAPRCCCKYPSAANEPCLPDTKVSDCSAVGGAVCLERLATANVNNIGLEEFGDATCAAGGDARQIVRVTGVESDGTARTFDDVDLTTVGTPVPFLDISIFAQQPSGQERVYTNFLGGSTTFEVNPASAGFILGAVNLLGAPLQLPATSEYTITVSPAGSAPNVFSGFIGADGRRAFITVLDADAGQYRLSFSSGGGVFGLLSFDGPINSVEVEYPSLLTGAPVSVITTSGFFATFAGPYTPPAASGIAVAKITGPGDDATAADVVEALAAEESAACFTGFLNTAVFPVPANPQVIPVDGLAGDIRVNFGTAFDEDSLLLHVSGLVPGSSFAIFQNDQAMTTPTVGFPIVLTGDITSVDRSFTVGASGAGAIQVFGTPSQIIFNFDGAQGPTAPTDPRSPFPFGGPIIGFSTGGAQGAEVVPGADAANDAYLTSFA